MSRTPPPLASMRSVRSSWHKGGKTPLPAHPPRRIAGNPCAGARSPSAEQALDIRQLQFHVGRAAMIALPAVRGGLHLAQQSVHLLDGKAPSRAHRAMAGERAAYLLQPLLER